MASPEALEALPKDSHDRGPGFVACVAVTTAVAFILVSLRTYVRLAIVRRFGLDDYTILLAVICNIVAFAFNVLEVSSGFGKHVTHLTLQDQVNVRKWNWALIFPILLGSGLSKIAISLLLLRLLGTASTLTNKYILHGINIFIVVYTMLDIINNATSCIPVEKTWDLELPGACRSLNHILGFTYFQGACSAFAALVLSSLPVVFFGNLQLDTRVKVVVCLLMSVGVFDAVCAIVRSTLLPGYTKSLDFSYTAVPITIWGNLELSFAIYAACVPTLRPLFRYFNSSPKRSALTSHSAPTPSRQGFLKQSVTKQSSHESHSNHPEISGQYSLTSFDREV